MEQGWPKKDGLAEKADQIKELRKDIDGLEGDRNKLEKEMESVEYNEWAKENPEKAKNWESLLSKLTEIESEYESNEAIPVRIFRGELSENAGGTLTHKEKVIKWIRDWIDDDNVIYLDIEKQKIRIEKESFQWTEVDSENKLEFQKDDIERKIEKKLDWLDAKGGEIDIYDTMELDKILYKAKDKFEINVDEYRKRFKLLEGIAIQNRRKELGYKN